MTWQQELSHLVACGWEPFFKFGRFGVRSSYSNITVTLTPPQGIYTLWFATVTISHPRKASVTLSGGSAFDLMDKIRLNI